jgi:hypothetical protein
MDDEVEPFHGKTDHRYPAGAGGRDEDSRRLPQAWDQQREAKNGGLVVSGARRLKTVDDENKRNYRGDTQARQVTVTPAMKPEPGVRADVGRTLRCDFFGVARVDSSQWY